MELKLDLIRQDGGTQPRAQVDNQVVLDYADEMQNGGTFPAITVFFDGSTYWLADGFHRLAAARQAGQQSIEADVRQGTQHDAHRGYLAAD